MPNLSLIPLLPDSTFKSYFEEEQDPGSHEILARDAETADIMTKEEALAFLKSDELKSEVEAGIRKAQARGISGVPFTILNGAFDSVFLLELT